MHLHLHKSLHSTQTKHPKYYPYGDWALRSDHWYAPLRVFLWLLLANYLVWVAIANRLRCNSQRNMGPARDSCTNRIVAEALKWTYSINLCYMSIYYASWCYALKINKLSFFYTNGYEPLWGLWPADALLEIKSAIVLPLQFLLQKSDIHLLTCCLYCLKYWHLNSSKAIQVFAMVSDICGWVRWSPNMNRF